MQVATNLETSEIFGTYVYKVGLINAESVTQQVRFILKLYKPYTFNLNEFY